MSVVHALQRQSTGLHHNKQPQRPAVSYLESVVGPWLVLELKREWKYAIGRWQRDGRGRRRGLQEITRDA